MRLRVLFLGGLLILTAPVVAQTECRQANGKVVERRDGFTLLSVTLPSHPSSIAAVAVVANDPRRTGAYVFTLSKLLVLDPQRSTEMLPAAIQLASEGHSSIVLDRVLTWPNIDETVGQMKSQALCAEQWLSTHAATTPDVWNFIGPTQDEPSLEQLLDVGDVPRLMVFWGFPVAEYGHTEGPKSVRQGIEVPVVALAHSHE